MNPKQLEALLRYRMEQAHVMEETDQVIDDRGSWPIE